MPMTAVEVCRVTPTYGAISRNPTISRTSTAPLARNTRNVASRDGRAVTREAVARGAGVRAAGVRGTVTPGIVATSPPAPAAGGRLGARQGRQGERAVPGLGVWWHGS